MKPPPTTLIPSFDVASPPDDERTVPSRAALRIATAHVAIERIAGRSAVTRLSAQSPLKLLTPGHRAPCATVITSSLGGGLVEGDHLRLHVRAAQDTRLALGTQSSTKVYRCPAGAGCSQHLTLDAAADSITVIAPDPVTPFEGAMYDQHQSISLAPTASLVLIDWLTSGRVARGERWAFRHYHTRTNVAISGKPVLADALRLSAADGPIAATCRTGGFDCFATLVLLGPAIAAFAQRLLDQVAQCSIHPLRPVCFSASPLRGGAIVRLAGPGPEPVGRWIRQRLDFVPQLLGSDPWLRKW